jgi:hypothetical protein
VRAWRGVSLVIDPEPATAELATAHCILPLPTKDKVNLQWMKSMKTSEDLIQFVAAISDTKSF